MTLTKLLVATVKGLSSRTTENTVPRLVFLSSIGLLFLAFAVSQVTKSHLIADVMAGCILSLTNAFLGYMFIERGFQYNNNLFVVFTLGGQALRFFLMIGSIAIILVMLDVLLAPFILSFMISYIVFLMFEVVYINRKVDLMKEQKKLALSVVEP